MVGNVKTNGPQLILPVLRHELLASNWMRAWLCIRSRIASYFAPMTIAQ
jgi:hypothetical protein